MVAVRLCYYSKYFDSKIDINAVFYQNIYILFGCAEKTFKVPSSMCPYRQNKGVQLASTA